MGPTLNPRAVGEAIAVSTTMRESESKMEAPAETKWVAAAECL